MTNHSEIAPQIISKMKELIPGITIRSYDDNLVEEGLDSLNTIRLLVEIETMFGISFEDEELITENYSTLQMILDCVSKILQQQNAD